MAEQQFIHCTRDEPVRELSDIKDHQKQQLSPPGSTEMQFGIWEVALYQLNFKRLSTLK